MKLMKAVPAIGCLCVGLVIGATTSWLVFRHQYSKWAVEFASGDVLTNMATAYRALQSLRNDNNEQAIEELESKLDTEILAMGGIISEVSDEKRRTAYIRTLNRVREYRKNYPRQTDSPETDDAVAAALSAWDNSVSPAER